jgi:hypothetical protein
MTRWAAWTIAVPFSLSMSVAAFAERATLSCSISDGTTTTYTLYGDSCESTKETATCSGPNGNTVGATCDKGCMNSGGYYKVACQAQTATSPEPTRGTAVKNPLWGMQLAADWSESKAWATYRLIQKQYAALIGDLKPISISTRDVGTGRVRYNIRIADDDRDYLEKLCLKLIAAGGACVVLRNDSM